MNQPFEYPEQSMAKDLFPCVQHHFQDASIELAEGKELQDCFAIFYVIRHGLRVAKLRVSAKTHLMWRDTGILSRSDIEKLPA